MTYAVEEVELMSSIRFCFKSSALLLMEFLLLVVSSAGSVSCFLSHNLLVLLFVFPGRRRGNCLVDAHRLWRKKNAWFSHTEVYTVLSKNKTTPTMEYIYTPDNTHKHVQNQNHQVFLWTRFRMLFSTIHCAFYIHFTMS